jgi:hypothetical protein
MVFARLQGELQVSTQKRRPKFGNQFLSSIRFAPEAVAAEVTVQSAFVFSPMRAFVGESCIVPVFVLEALEQQHSDRISGDAVKGAIPGLSMVAPRARKNFPTCSMRATAFRFSLLTLATRPLSRWLRRPRVAKTSTA